MLALRRLLGMLLVAVTLLLLTPMAVSAQVHEHQDENGAPMLRSLESLRDLDYQSWRLRNLFFRRGVCCCSRSCVDHS